MSKYRIIRIINEWKPRRDDPKGYKRVQAIVQVGRDLDATKHIYIPIHG